MITPTLPRLAQRRHLRHEIADALRGALVAGQLRPGVVYSAPMLAAQFGVSVTPVREALLDLSGEGLVESVRNKGFRVTELAAGDLDEITDLRVLIEVPTVRDLAGATGQHLRGQVEALRPAARRIVDHAAAGRVVEYVEADRTFHLALLALAGNKHLVDVVGNLRSRSRLHGLAERSNAEQLLRSAREHEQLLDLVLAGDPDAVEDLMTRHITDVRTAWAG
ncbi:GntR family transcriptional regulator [Nocardioides sp.]|uniref:GntR family transcriptional regulator n=1 Tax=Nocardioides sp. TaxID=35761 RepID=UPI002ED4FD43